MTSVHVLLWILVRRAFRCFYALAYEHSDHSAPSFRTAHASRVQELASSPLFPMLLCIGVIATIASLSRYAVGTLSGMPLHPHQGMADLKRHKCCVAMSDVHTSALARQRMGLSMHLSS